MKMCYGDGFLDKCKRIDECEVIDITETEDLPNRIYAKGSEKCERDRKYRASDTE